MGSPLIKKAVFCHSVEGAKVLDGEKLQVKYFLFITASFYMQIILPAHLFTVAGIQTGPQTVCQPQTAAYHPAPAWDLK